MLAAVVQLHTSNDELVSWQGQGLVGVTKADVMETVAAQGTRGRLEELAGGVAGAVRQGPRSMGACSWQATARQAAADGVTNGHSQVPAGGFDVGQGCISGLFKTSIQWQYQHLNLRKTSWLRQS
jgi:hypothetical protein